MNTPSTELFNIIKSFTSNEKRLFKRYLQQNSQNTVYLKLFDAIDLLEQYDEKTLMHYLSKKGGIKNLSRIKNYLLEVLLSFLEYYYNDSSTEIKLRKLLHRVEVLFSKRLFATATKCIKKAERIAIENHCHWTMLNILMWEHKIMAGQDSYKLLNQHNQEKYCKELHYMELYKNEIEYRKIKIEVKGYLYTHVGSHRGHLDKTAREKLNLLLKNPLLKGEKQTLSIPAKYNYWYILAVIHFILKNRKKSYDCFKQTIDHFDQAKIEPRERLIVFSQFTSLLSELKKADEIKEVAENAIKIKDSLPTKLQTTNFYSLYLTLMNNYIDHQLNVYNLGEALYASDTILLSIKKHTTSQGYMVYYTNRFLINFLQADYHKALHCANEVLAFEKTGVRPDIIYSMKLFYFVVHYELGNEEIFSNLCQSHTTYLKQQLQNKLDQVLLTFFGKAIQANTSRQKRKNSFIELKKKLELCKKGNIFNQFDFISWAESKIENRPMIEVLKEKVGKVEGLESS